MPNPTMTRLWKRSSTATLAMRYFFEMLPLSSSCGTPKIRVPTRNTRRFVMAAKVAAGINSLQSL